MYVTVLLSLFVSALEKLYWVEMVVLRLPTIGMLKVAEAETEVPIELVVVAEIVLLSAKSNAWLVSVCF